MMDEILPLLDLLNKYSSLILVLATVIYVIFTYKLSRETTKLREIETTPFISLSFDTSFVSKFKLTVKNISKAPAYNISFGIDEKYASHFNYNFNNTISYFAPTQEFQIIASGYKELDALDCESIPITVHYESKDKIKLKETFNMEWKYLEQTLLETDEVEKMRKAIEGIEKEVKSLNKTIQTKEYMVTTKLKIIELEKTDMYLKFIFSNGYLGKIHNNDITQLGITDLSQTHTDNGNLTDYSNRMKFTAEEIYHKLIQLSEREGCS